MPTITLKNTAPVMLHGKKPGETFDVETDAEKIPLDHLWRKRLRDGAVEIVSGASSAPAPIATPTLKGN